MQPQSKKTHDFMLILIPSFVVIVAWIIFHIYNSAVSSTITTTQNALISPISPNFDMSVLTSLSQREDVTPLSHVDVPSPGSPVEGQEDITPPPAATASPILVTPSPIRTGPTPSISLSPTQVASPGGTQP